MFIVVEVYGGLIDGVTTCKDGAVAVRHAEICWMKVMSRGDPDADDIKVFDDKGRIIWQPEEKYEIHGDVRIKGG